MSIQLRRRAEDVLLELGGGANPVLKPRCQGGPDVCVDVRTCHNAEGLPTVDFVADFNESLPIKDGDFDGVFSQFVLEHVSWRKVRQFVSEMFRVTKPGGRCVCITANTEAQIKYIEKNPRGWDSKPDFESFSCVIFGDNDYPENSHKNYLSPNIAGKLFMDSGYTNVVISAYGAANTDMMIQAVKPVVLPSRLGNTTDPQAIMMENKEGVPPGTIVTTVKSPEVKSTLTREEMFDKHYFNGGQKVGGYMREGYWDYPVHSVTAQHVLARKPSSVLEIGAARGYILKRIQNAGVFVAGLEISKHCIMTRVCNPIVQADICQTPWSDKFKLENMQLDLCFSIAVMEHIPQEHIPAVIREMARTCKRGLMGIDFGEHDDGSDKTHCSLYNKARWEAAFAEYAPGWPVEILDKEELERGEMPPEVLRGDGRIKLNVGSYTVMHHHGWMNMDLHDLSGFAAAYKYNFLRHDIRTGLPYGTGVVDAVNLSHVLEHLTYEEGLNFLRECRRVIRPDGAIRIAVPDAERLMRSYAEEMKWSGSDGRACMSWCLPLADFGEISDAVSKAPTPLVQLWELLQGKEHLAFYDAPTLSAMLTEAAFQPLLGTPFTTDGNDRSKQILAETFAMFPALSLVTDGVPIVG